MGSGFTASICGISAWEMDTVSCSPPFPFSVREQRLRCTIYKKPKRYKKKSLSWLLLTCLLLLYVGLDLIQDWSSDSAPDIFSFVPYMWNFKVMFHQFEMIWAANQHNWIDCSTKQQENGESTFLLFGRRYLLQKIFTKYIVYIYREKV